MGSFSSLFISREDFEERIRHCIFDAVILHDCYDGTVPKQDLVSRRHDDDACHDALLGLFNSRWPVSPRPGPRTAAPRVPACPPSSGHLAGPFRACG